jgi:hypothetical protein
MPMDLTVEVEDDAGRVARFPLSRYGPVRRPLQSHVYRRAGRDKARFGNTWEIVLQTYTIPMSDAVAAAPGFDPTRIRHLRWRFDRTDAGTVLLDNIGVARPAADFFRGVAR